MALSRTYQPTLPEPLRHLPDRVRQGARRGRIDTMRAQRIGKGVAIPGGQRAGAVGRGNQLEVEKVVRRRGTVQGRITLRLVASTPAVRLGIEVCQLWSGIAKELWHF